MAQTIVRDGQSLSTVVPNPLTRCSQSQLTPQYLQFTYIQALKSIVTSPNTSTVILPFDQNLTPLLNVNPGGAAKVTTTPTTVAGP